MSTPNDEMLQSPTAPPRLDSIDMLRGLVMVIMALDHTRDFFGQRNLMDPTNLDTTTPALFLTRWITHYCAPVFVFLAGTGAFLSGTRGKSTGQLSWFLISRGLWLVLLDATVIRYSWQFTFSNDFIGIGVIWAIGWSMVVLSVLVYLPTSAITAFGVAMIVLHNAADKILPEQFGCYEWLWRVLHVSSGFNITEKIKFGAGYPLVPWIGVVAAGYGFGALFLLETRQRRRQLLGLGLMLTALFVAVRYLNRYGDLREWKYQDRGQLYTFFSFLDCHKYPPSLCYLLMTLGPAITLLALCDRASGPLARFFVTFGRVPLFYYLLHLPLIHGAAVGVAYLHYGSQIFEPDPSDLAMPPVVASTVGMMGTPLGEGPILATTALAPGRVPIPREFGNNLPEVYLAWICAVLFLYPLCYWFAGVKKRHRDWWWLSYL
jgi:uncharacterized membrane protein